MFNGMSIIIANVGENVEQLGLLYIDDKVQNGTHILGNSFHIFIKLNIHLIYNTEILLLFIQKMKTYDHKNT